MAENKLIAVLSLIALIILFNACNDSEDTRQRTVFGQAPEIEDIKPQKPVRIKLKRNADGNYTWELTGDDVEKILQSDKKIKDTLENRTSSN